MRRIAWQDGPEWTQSLKLDGRSYFIRAHWNDVAGRWSMDILTAQRERVLSAIRLVPGVRLIAQFRDTRLPPGDFAVTGLEPNYSSFREGTSQLLYIEAAEID